MTTKQAIRIIFNHQKWRLGSDKVKPTVPKKLTEALDIALDVMSGYVEKPTQEVKVVSSNIVFIYAKDEKIKVLITLDDHDYYKSKGWIHTHTLDVCSWLEHLCNIHQGSRESEVESLKYK